VDKNRAERHLRMPCCSSPVILRTSRRGTQFFAHKAVGECSTAPETEAHLRLKQMAVEVARAHGWDAETEVIGTTPSGEQWTADVLARRGDHKVAVEVQWSAQTNEETLSRQERYARSNVRCLWLLRQSGFPVDERLPAARVSGSPEEGFMAQVPTGVGEQSVPIRDFLEAAFSKRLRFGLPLGFPATVSVQAGRMHCWSCRALTRIISFVVVVYGPREYRLTVPDMGKYPDLFALIHSSLPAGLGLGAIKRRFSKTQGRSYLSNGCVRCDALVGQFHEYDAWEEQETVYTVAIRMDERWRTAIQEHGYDEGWAVYPAAALESSSEPVERRLARKS
jgi:hypothetical protein